MMTAEVSVGSRLSILLGAVGLLLLGGCKDGRRDGIVAERTAPPVRAVIRAHELDVPVTCNETGFKRLTCFFKTERRGCLYLEVGADADGPGPMPPMAAPGQIPADLCTLLPADPRRLLLTSYSGHHLPVALESDPEGARLAWRHGNEDWSIAYLLDGELVGHVRQAVTLNLAALGLHEGLSPAQLRLGSTSQAATSATPPAPVDWKTTPTLAQAAPTLLNELSADRRQALIAWLEKAGGEGALVSLLEHATPAQDWWDGVYEQLSEAGQKQAGERLRALLETDAAAAAEAPDPALLDWFGRHPEEEPGNYLEYLVAQVESGMGNQYDVETSSLYLDELIKRNHPRAGELGCRLLGSRVTEALQLSEAGGSTVSTLNVSALHAIALQKTACPWVEVALSRSACATELRCTPGGIPETSEEAWEIAPAPVPGQQNGLCSMAATQRHLGSWNPDDSPTPLGGLGLLAAAYALGPLPQEVLIRNARRLYRVEGRPPPRPEDDTEEIPGSPCDALPSTPEDLICNLPITVSEATVGGCRLRIDDDRRVLRLDDVRLRKTPVEPWHGMEGQERALH